MTRRIELACATLAAVSGIAGMAVALFAPTIRSETVTSDGIITNETYSMAADGVEAGVILVFALVAVLLAVLVAAALLRTRQAATGGSAPLWAPAIMLAILIFLTGYSVGPFFLPSVVLALAAAIAATRVPTSTGHPLH